MNDRLDWEYLPQRVRDVIEDRTGTVIKAESVIGRRPGVAARLYAEQDDVFVKAIPADSPAAEPYRREQWAGRHLPVPAPAPRSLWSLELDGWLVLAFELVNDYARHVDLRRDCADLPFVLDAVGSLAVERGAVSGPSAVEHFSSLYAKGRLVLDQPHVRDLYLRAMDGFDVDRLGGSTLIHGDLGPRTLLIKDGSAYAVDWSTASLGAWWIDLVLLAPQLIAEGHSPEQVDELLSGAVPAWANVPAREVIGLTAIWGSHHLYQAEHGPVTRRDDAVRLAHACTTWLTHWLPRL
ncbi:hypothetical protein ACWDA3_55910 [Nonomuraea rubra]